MVRRTDERWDDVVKIKGITDEDFVNYKKPSMFVSFPYCSFKCEKECGVRCCQNSELAAAPVLEIPAIKVVERYLSNPISKALVCGGLEPFDSWNDLHELVRLFRKKTSDDIVIYTGYKEFENSNFDDHLETLAALYSNIFVKFGRFIPNRPSIYDVILGITLQSDNQYAVKIS